MPIVLSGSLELTGSVVATGNFTTTGNITAQTLVVQTITSSINYITGSSDFGSLQSNRHTFTGSLYITGSTSTFSGCINVGRTDDAYRLNVAVDTPKTCTTARGLLSLTTCETFACNPFGLVITATGGATISDRRVTVGTTDFGLVNGGLLDLNGAVYAYNSCTVGIGVVPKTTWAGTSNKALQVGIRGAIGNSSTYGTMIAYNAYYDGAWKYICSGGASSFMIGGGDFLWYANSTSGNDGCTIASFDTAKMTLDSAGNLGLGITPCTWDNIFTSIDFKNKGSVASYTNYLQLIQNSYYASSNWKYKTTAPISAISLESDTGDIVFRNATSGTAGTTATLNDRVRIFNSGAVSVNSSLGAIDGSPQKFYVSGSMRMDVTGVSYGEGLIINTPANGTNYGGIFFHQTAANGCAVGASSIKWGINYNYTPEGGVGADNLAFVNANTTTMMNITSGGCVYIGKGWGATNHRINLQKPQGCTILVISGYSGAANDSVIISAASGAGYNGALTVMGVTTNSSSGRSISAGGTINASGGDYAEYMTKRCDTGCVAKGQIVGIDVCKLLTDKWSLAQSFVVKSTDPSYVGGDIWDKNIGSRPQQTTDITDEEFAPILAEYEAKLEQARHTVDRVAFSGQVPVIISGSYNVGDYILPIEGPNDTIIGVACSLSSLTLEDYGKTVGKVWGSCLDKAWIAVKIG